MVRLALSYSSGRKQRLQRFAKVLPADILVFAGDRIRKNRKRHRPEAGESGKDVFSPLYLGADARSRCVSAS